MANIETKRILIVDDDKRIAEFLLEVLEGKGYDVKAVNCPNEAQIIITMESFDALLIDMCMPELSGENLIKSIIKFEEQYKGKIILMTGDVKGIDQMKNLSEIGIECVLLKPFSVDELIITLEDLFAEK